MRVGLVDEGATGVSLSNGGPTFGLRHSQQQ